jgi:hypothetical protein
MTHSSRDAALRAERRKPAWWSPSRTGRLLCLSLFVAAMCGLLPGVLPVTSASAGGREACAGRQPCDLGGRFVLANYLPERHAAGGLQISGVCYSRCTLDLAAGACVWPDAELGFHAVRNSSGEIDRVATMMVESLYPIGVRNWIRRVGAMNSGEITKLSGAQAIRLGIPACGRRVLSAN